MASTEVDVGHVAAGKYELVRLLGRGSMGERAARHQPRALAAISAHHYTDARRGIRRVEILTMRRHLPFALAQVAVGACSFPHATFSDAGSSADDSGGIDGSASSSSGGHDASSSSYLDARQVRLVRLQLRHEVHMRRHAVQLRVSRRRPWVRQLRSLTACVTPSTAPNQIQACN
jgi:hypothetical protein